MSFVSIAIDGPSGAGKSTLAKMTARALGYLYVDTGAIYRTVALHAMEEGVDLSDGAGVLALLPAMELKLGYGPDGLQHMVLNGRDVTGDIRRHEVSRGASQVSAIPGVRAFLLEMQRELARTHNVVMDGRDIGTVVLPGADLKFFLTARPEDRARRRFLELQQRGEDTSYETVLRDVIRRDADDMERAAAPLRQAEDAVLVDTTGKTLEESFQLLLQLIEEGLRHE